MASDDLIAQFVAVTGTSEQIASSYLDRNDDNLVNAIEDFYDSSKKPVATAQSSKSQRTLKDLNEEENDDDTNNNFFTGGEKSALQVEDPNKDKDGERQPSLVEQLFQKAREQMGQVDDRPSAKMDSDESRAPKFSGTGFKLGDGTGDSEVIRDTTTRRNQAPAKVTREITFWRQGFTVADGPLHRYDDPENANVLQELNRGRVPMSILDVEYGQDVDVSVFKKTDEDYVPPKKSISGFHGVGQRLGSPVPGDHQDHQDHNLNTETNNNPVSNEDVDVAPEPVNEGDSAVQIRFANGKKIKHSFNSTDSIATVYDFVRTNSLNDQSRDFVLTHAFPVKPIEDSENITVADAKLKNAVIVQRWK